MRPDSAGRRRSGAIPAICLTATVVVGLSSGGPGGRVAATGSAGQVAPPAPHRVFASATRQPSTFDALVDDLITADVVFIGEQHGNAPTHQIELALLQHLGRRRDLILALEMFERDVQEPLEHFVMGHMPEAEFLKDARPWPRYATDYKPLVDFAIAREWAVVAANVPRSIAAEVARLGAPALENRPSREQGWFAGVRECPTSGAYFARFKAALTNHQSGEATTQTLPPAAPIVASSGESARSSVPLDDAAVERYYLAQCLKDETMAESIAQAHGAGSIGNRRALVVTVNGAFHTEFGQGLAAATSRRLPGRRVVTVAMLPVADLGGVSPGAIDWTRADHLIYTAQ